MWLLLLYVIIISFLFFKGIWVRTNCEVRKRFVVVLKIKRALGGHLAMESETIILAPSCGIWIQLEMGIDERSESGYYTLLGSLFSHYRSNISAAVRGKGRNFFSLSFKSPFRSDWKGLFSILVTRV